MSFAFCFPMGMFCGCVHLGECKPYFKDYYSSREEIENNKILANDYRKFTFSANKMPLRDFTLFVSRLANVSIVYNQKLSDSLVSGDFINESVTDILNGVSRSLDVNLIRNGENLYYIGSIPDDEKACFVCRVYGYKPEDIKKSIETLSGFSGKCNVTNNGVLVVTDKESIISRVYQLVGDFQRFVPDTYILQFYLVTFKDEKSLSMGLDLYSSGELSLLLSDSSLKFNATNFGWRLNQVLSGKNYGSRIISSPLMLLVAGVPCVWQNGSSIPVPQKTVSDSGTVTTSGFTNVDVGLKIEVTLREHSANTNLVELKLEDSSVLSYVDYNPVKSQTLYNSSFVLENGRVYLVGELNRTNKGRGINNLISFKTENTNERIVIFAKCYRMGEYYETSN